jgi:hypothetical protein
MARWKIASWQKLCAAAGQRAALASALPKNLLTRRSDPPRHISP